MTSFEEILNKVDFNCVWVELVSLYPDILQTKEKYKIAFESLLSKRPEKNVEEMIIHIDSADYESDVKSEDSVTEYRVHGKNNSLEWTGYWDISSNNWAEWLGFYVNNSVLEKFSAEQIVALCLYEMTWFGFSEEKILSRLVNLEEDE
ncbi:DUF6557 family protein [Paenibacillus mesotrionivorans]|uniref:DUF6557 family protein n=1 Tax=Paenibacillus mesotrionivorans TaxID=3160968 RepID=A0ACC7NXC6_9BACL